MSGDGQLSPLFTWRSAIVESNLLPVTRHVALTLSMHMNERGGSCFPSIATQAQETGLSPRTISDHLTILEEAGYLSRTFVRRGEGRGTTVQYSATTPRQTTCGLTTGGLTTCSPTHDHMSFDDTTTRGQTTCVEDVNEDVIEDVNTNENARSHKTSATKTRDEQAFAEFWAGYPKGRYSGRPSVQKAWSRVPVKDRLVVMLGLSVWVEHWKQAQTEPSFIPYAEKWLKNKSWEVPPTGGPSVQADIIELADGWRRNTINGELWNPERNCWQVDRDYVRPRQVRR